MEERCNDSSASSSKQPSHPPTTAVELTPSSSSTTAKMKGIETKADHDLITSSEESGDEGRDDNSTRNVRESFPPQASHSKRKASGDFQVLEEITSGSSEDGYEAVSSEEDDLQPVSEEEEEIEKLETESTRTSQPEVPPPPDINPQTRNEQDLTLLLQTLEENPEESTEEKRICFYCFRVGHITVSCEDKKNKVSRRCPIWLQGMRQRRYIFYDMNPKTLDRHKETVRHKRKRLRRNHQIRQENENLEEVRKRRERLETAQELLEMAQKLMEEK